MKRLALHLQLLGLRFRHAMLERMLDEYDEDRADEVSALSVRIAVIRWELAA